MKGNYFIFFVVVAVAFVITGLNFENLGYDENKNEYLLLLMVLMVGLIYIFRRNKR
ncbi:MAG TPA: hypothetical protein VFF21_01435 [Flavobacteriaceae bacterium]|nr:hypothetical protein [Flavobacteriaceae bacterium]